MTDHFKLGTGVLTWGRGERIGDRYGQVYLMQDGCNSINDTQDENQLLQPFPPLDGLRGTLVATVIDARESTHIGDMFRGIGPVTPEAGERIVLGTGTLVTESPGWTRITVGVKPDQPDDYGSWMDVEKLYRAHEQLVELTFEQEGV